jgi:protein-S-isoprenylcysteine O-methyltransferase Ste14
MMVAFLRYCAGKIEFSPSFISDCAVSSAYVLVTAFLYVASAHTAPTTEAVIFIAVIVLEAQATKVALMFSLDRRGGDAGLGQSHKLVTDGLYGFSRNPAYLITIVQNMLWSLLLLLTILGGRADTIAVLVIVALPVIHFFVLDRLVIRQEERNLARWHPAAYAAYAANVNRWIGRRRGAAQPVVEVDLSTASSQGN